MATGEKNMLKKGTFMWKDNDDNQRFIVVWTSLSSKKKKLNK